MGGVHSFPSGHFQNLHSHILCPLELFQKYDACMHYKVTAICGVLILAQLLWNELKTNKNTNQQGIILIICDITHMCMLA